MTKFSKIGVIISHEFTTRIKSKGFIIGTLLAPVGMLVVVLIPMLSAMFAEDDSVKRVAVIDQSSLFAERLVATDSAMFFTTPLTEEQVRSELAAKKFAGYLVIQPDILTTGNARLVTTTGAGLLFQKKINDALDDIMRASLLKKAGIDSLIGKQLEKGVTITKSKLDEGKDKSDTSDALAFVGYIFGFMIYIMMFIYGGTVMRAVLEEKTNRIIEVLASSAKPFEIMMGKILGVGAVGLVQVLLWIVLSTAISTVVAPLLMGLLGQDASTSAELAQGSMASSSGFSIPDIPIGIIVAFVLYFLMGYFMYSTLFAAVAAAADREEDIQSLQAPITIPLIIPMLFIGNIMLAPDGMLSTVLSMIPLFTPTIMIIRLTASTVPVWQLIVSSLLMIAFFIVAVWAAGRIYRTGILSYGKKATLKDIARWLVKG